MSSKAVKDKIRTYLKANWTATALIEVENTDGTHPDDEPWIALSFPGAISEPMAIGNRCWREPGMFQIYFHALSGKGTDELDILGDQMTSLLRGQNIDGVVIDLLTTPSYSEGHVRQEIDIGNFYQYVMTVDYHHDTYV